MKKLKKITLILGISLLLVVMGVVSVSASAISMGKPNDIISPATGSPFASQDIFVKYEAEDYKDCTILAWLLTGTNSPVHIIYTEEFFEEYEECFISSNDIDEAWNKVLSSSDVHTCDYNFSSEYKSTTFNDFINIYIDLSQYGGTVLKEDDFKSHFVAQFSYYYEIKQLENVVIQKDTELTNLETLKNEEIADLNTTITEKDAVITEKDSTITSLQSDKERLETNNEALDKQVTALVDNRIALNAEITSLKNQMQLKINKAYAEGLQDSDGNGNRMNGFITTMISILTLLEVLALVYYIVSKVKKKRSQK